MPNKDYFNEFLLPDFNALDQELSSNHWVQKQDEMNQLKMQQNQGQGPEGQQPSPTDSLNPETEQMEAQQGYRPTYNRVEQSETKQERLQRVKEEYGRRPFVSVGCNEFQKRRQQRKVKIEEYPGMNDFDPAKGGMTSDTAAITQLVATKKFCKQNSFTIKEAAKQYLELEKDGEYILPELPYAYNALEPHIDEETMKLHHDKHHQKYVDDLNEALKAMSKLKKDDPQVRALTDKVAFNSSGHVLHSIFWLCLNPKAQKEPEKNSPLGKAIKEQFGNFKKFFDQLIGAAQSVQGSGWAIVSVDHTGRLLILQAEKHQNLASWGSLPILALDVWEHAYYLKYKNDRSAYLEAVCNNLLDWNKINDFYTKAARQK